MKCVQWHSLMVYVLFLPYDVCVEALHQFLCHATLVDRLANCLTDFLTE